MYKLKTILSEQTDPRAKAADISLAKQLAKRIYNAKGTFIDNESEALSSIKAIPNRRIFDLTQKELQKLTGGRGIGQYVTSFIGNIEDIIPKGLGIHATGNFEGERTLPLLSKIISHLTKIGAPKQTVQILDTYKTKLSSKVLGNIWSTPETMHDVNTIGSIVSLVAGPIGLALSSAFQLADAKQYYDEGKNYEAGLALVFALLPGGAKLGSSLVKKIVSKSGILTKAEQKLLTSAAANKTAIKSKINNMVASGIESGRINPYALKSVRWIKPLGKGAFNIGGNIIKYAAVPMIGYDVAFNALNPPLSDADLSKIMYTQLNAKLNAELTK